MRVNDCNITANDVGPRNGRKRSQAMKTNKIEPSLAENEQKGPAPNGSKLHSLFQQFLALEADGKSVNKHKAEVFAKAKEDGFDPKALRTAFRHLVREMAEPEATAKHDELTDQLFGDPKG
jgi:uncharacterized protein (UPF0335 family)